MQGQPYERCNRSGRPWTTPGGYNTGKGPTAPVCPVSRCMAELATATDHLCTVSPKPPTSMYSRQRVPWSIRTMSVQCSQRVSTAWFAETRFAFLRLRLDAVDGTRYTVRGMQPAGKRAPCCVVAPLVGERLHTRFRRRVTRVRQPAGAGWCVVRRSYPGSRPQKRMREPVRTGRSQTSLWSLWICVISNCPLS